MAKTLTRHFGEIDYSERDVVEFPSGLPAFEQEREFVLLEQEATRPLVFLQSLSDPRLCFVTVPVRAVTVDYGLSVLEEDLERIGLAGGGQPDIGTEVDCLAILTLAEGREPTANLLAPVLVNRATRRAVQAVQVDTEYSCRHPLGERR